MLYITGIYALNLPCGLETCGDWHQSALKWDNPEIKESTGSFFGDYGIEKDHNIPEHTEKYNVANTLRAILDMLYDRKYSIAQGSNQDYICNEKYDVEFFSQVCKMRSLSYWNEIYAFMKKEYRIKWLDYCKERDIT